MALTNNSLCTAATFSPTLFGASILDVSVSLVTDYNTVAREIYNYNHPTIKVTNATFCNVTITYTHPGQGDTINVEAWLPTHEKYNGRLQATGGGGYIAGRFFLSYTDMAGAIEEGYATMTTDAGLGYATDASPWGQVSEGNVNLYALQNFGSVSLYEEAILTKALVQDYYGAPPKYSYWSGCSQGGRQGLMLAQRYPGLYDGIAASAPGNNWNELVPSTYFPQLEMNLLGQYPRACELDFLGAEATKACDSLDGVADGLVSDPDACHFDPFSLVGTSFSCAETGTNLSLSFAAANIANITWTGSRTSNGDFIWYGYSPGSPISGTGVPQSVAATTCSANGTCTGAPTLLGAQWIQLFVEKNPDYDLTKMTRKDFDDKVHYSKQQFNDIYSANDPDLTRFRDAGGKMLGYHGLLDEIIPPKGSEHYYNAVTEVTPDVHDFYRYYKVPGLRHCSGGNGGQPTAIWAALTAWVENGTVPEALPISFTNSRNSTSNRKLCPYPQKAIYDGYGDTDSADSFNCIA
ncbi:feruloyl esterase [Bisporella sp. PMI_857]|nr:feruloyl esterase [Bisporella sp. PMI_857]